MRSSRFAAWNVTRHIFFSLYLILMVTFLLYSLFEFFPILLNVVNLQKIRYYAQRAEYVSDPTLVFVPRRKERVIDIEEFRGEAYLPDYRIDVPPIRYHASYNREGFRINSSQPPFDMVVVGDSYIEFGETDDSTLPELIKKVSGLSTLNLGRGWYGPPQYVEVLKRYGLGVQAKYAVLAFFSGNDAEDTRQYIRWQRGGEGGDYYSFIVGRTNYFIRYLHALRDTYKVIKDAVKGHVSLGAHTAFANDSDSNGVHPDLGLIQLRNQVVPMTFHYWNPHVTSENLLMRQEWKRLGTVMADFKVEALKHGMVPIVVFIPTKAEVYGSFFNEHSGQRFMMKIREQVKFERNTMEAFEAVAGEQGVQVINLFPHFKDLAQQGILLYHPFDTHWNLAGRQAAAEVIESEIRDRLRGGR